MPCRLHPRLLMGCVALPLCASSAAVIEAGTDIQKVINLNPAGTRYLVRRGVYRLQSIQPKDRDTFEGEPGAILNGARVITRFQPAGSVWVASAPRVLEERGRVPCRSGEPACQYVEELFFDDARLGRVSSLGDVRHGTWYLDGATGNIYVGDNPNGKRVELSEMPFAFRSASNGVAIRGFTIEKYANAAQNGAIHAIGQGWTIERNEIRLNHGAGVFVAARGILRSNRIHHNGQLGIGGDGPELLLENNEVTDNNTANFDFLGTDGEAGGIKIVQSTGLVIRNNFIHRNNGPGIWLDTDNVTWRIEGNRLSGDRLAGILIETSYAGIIRSNILEREGHPIDPARSTLWWCAAISIHSSRDVEVYGNTLIGSGNGIGIISSERGSGKLGAHSASGIRVRENVVIGVTSTAAGVVADIATPHVNAYSAWQNLFTGNRYLLRAGSPEAFTWYTGGSNYANINFRKWQQAGHDENSALLLPDEITGIRKFAAGNRIRVTVRTEAYSLPFREAARTAMISPGEQGTVTPVRGPVHSSSDWWWNIRYDTGVQGWSPATGLEILR
jgi:hypothetical protein